MPEPVRSLVEIRHRQVGRHGAPVGAGGAARSSACEKSRSVAPRVTLLQLLRRMCFGRKTACAVSYSAQSRCRAAPPPPSGGTAACPDRASGCGTWRTPGGRLDPGDRPLEHVRPIVVEAQDEAAVDLDAVVVQDRDAPRIVRRARRLLARLDQVLVRRATRSRRRPPCSRPAPSRGPATGSSVDVDRHRRAPDLLQRPQGPAERAQVLGPRAEVVVDEDAVGLRRRRGTRRRPAPTSRTWYGMRSPSVAR